MIELSIGTNASFSDVLLKATDGALLSLGKPIKSAIYFHLENSMGIKRNEIPFRIADFQNALERIFGIGARHLEILFVKNLHDKLRIKCKWDMPRWVVPELTFHEYVHLVKMACEESDARIDEKALEAEAL